MDTEKKRLVIEVTPWYNKHEFEEVYKGLYSRNIFDMRWAVDRVTVWESRCHPSLDVGVDATASIVRAVIQDELYQSNTSLCQPPDLRLLYSSALTRFTNVVSELSRSHEVFTSVRKAAAKMGIPEWIVDLRHSASHLRVPSLQQLRSGAIFALDYLRTNFWEKEMTAFHDYTELRDATMTEMEDVIATYQNCQYEMLFNESEPKRRTRSKVKVSLLAMKFFIIRRLKEFLNVLLKPGFFLPCAQDLIEILKHADETYFIERRTVDLPSTLQKFWMPVIMLLIEQGVIQEFAELLLKAQGTKDDLHQKVAACWVLKLIQSEEGSILDAISIDARPTFNWIRLLGPCLDNCCPYTPALLPIIVDRIDPPISDKQRSSIMALVAVFLGATTPSCDSKKEFVSKVSEMFTVEQVKRDIKLRREKQEQDCPWHEPPEGIDWSAVPLGFVFGNQMDFTDNIPPVINLEETDTSAKLVSTITKPEKKQETAGSEVNKEMEIVTDAASEEPQVKYRPEKMTLYPPVEACATV